MCSCVVLQETGHCSVEGNWHPKLPHIAARQEAGKSDDCRFTCTSAITYTCCGPFAVMYDVFAVMSLPYPYPN
jgi:hypothetical protein